MNDDQLAIRSRASAEQLFRYAFVGLLSNLAGYLAYLTLIFFGGTPKATMTVLYGVGATIGYFGNRLLTFEHKGRIWGAGVRYMIAHCFGYLINLAILMVFVDRLSYAHQWVQGVAILIVAAFLFMAFKLFVFRDPRKSGEACR